MRVLVVEDEQDGQQVVAGILEISQIEWDLASTAEEGMQLLEHSQYDACIIDLALPGMNGFDLVSHIRNSPPIAHLPCIAYTAYHTSKVRKDAMDVGFDAYFEKPLPQQILVDTLHRLID